MATGSEDAPVWFMAPPKPGDKATCIVTGEVFTVAKDTIVKEYQGSFSALCCEGCEKDFEAAAMANPPKASMPTPR